jgi:hypothetical protein
VGGSSGPLPFDENTYGEKYGTEQNRKDCPLDGDAASDDLIEKREDEDQDADLS